VSLGFDLFWPAYLVLAFAAAVVVAHVAAYRQTTRPISSTAKAGLLSLRFAALTLVMLVLWRPAMEGRETVSRKARLAFLIDASKSMSIGDEECGAPGAGCSRLARAAAVFDASGDAWERVCDAYDVAGYSFAVTLAPLATRPKEPLAKPLFGLSPDGPVTALGDALQEASRSAPAPEVILVISDGLSNAGTDPIDSAAPGGAAIYAIGVGRDSATASTRDVAATGIYAPPDAFAGSDVTVVATFTAAGLEGRSFAVHFLLDGKEMDTKEIKVPTREALLEARFTFKPEDEGPARIEAKAEPLADEILAANNSVATYIDVKKGRTRILYLEGTFRWEAKFVRMAVESARDVDMRLVVPKAADDAAIAAALAEDWDVLVIGDLPAKAIPDASLSKAAGAVLAGRGILFLGGANAFGAGGWGETALAECVPFQVGRGETVDNGLYRVSARTGGPYGEMLALGPGGSTAIWEELPPVLAVNRVGAAKPGASVLLEGLPARLDETSGAVSADGTRPAAPVVAVMDYGRGRAAAVTYEGTWQWATGAGLSGTAKRDAAAEIHKRFWRKLVFWLAKREERGGITVQLALARHEIEVGRSVEMEAQVLDGELNGLTDAALTAEIVSGDKTWSKAFWSEGGKYKTDFRAAAAGDYSVKVRAARDGKVIAEASSAFVAAAADAELATLVARPGTLEAVSRATGGGYATADDAGRVLDDILKRARETQYVKLQRIELWSSWWYVAAIVGLLTLEWALRKRMGLV